MLEFWPLLNVFNEEPRFYITSSAIPLASTATNASWQAPVALVAASYAPIAVP